MPKKIPPYVSKEQSRHGQVRYYFRRKHGKRVRLPDLYDTAFDDAYMAALREDGKETGASVAASDPRSLEWLIRQYRQSSTYVALAPLTKKQRDHVLGQVIDSSGSVPFRSITKKHIADGRDRRAKTPSQARNFLKTLSGLFKWALELDYIEIDPTAGVSRPKPPNKDGYPAWTEEDVELYEARWPLGTNERVWFDVLLYTGLRRGDAVILGRQHIKNGIITIRAAKTDTEVNIPVARALQASIDAGPIGDLHLIIGKGGKPLRHASFGNLFRQACNAAGVTKSAHGIRKIAAVRAAESGASVAQLEAMFGWTGGRMAALYTRSVNRRKLALEGWAETQNQRT